MTEVKKTRAKRTAPTEEMILAEIAKLQAKLETVKIKNVEEDVLKEFANKKVIDSINAIQTSYNLDDKLVLQLLVSALQYKGITVEQSFAIAAPKKTRTVKKK